MVTIETVELQRENFPAPKGDFIGPYVDWDNNGFQHEIYVRQEGTNTDDSTRLHYVKKNAQGQVVDSGEMQPPSDQNGKAMKYVGVSSVLKIIPPGQNVATIIVNYTIHGAGPNNGRTAARGYHKIPGVYAPHARGERADELFDVVLPDADPIPNPGGSGVTPQDIEAIKNAIINQLRQEFGGNIRQGIEDKTKDAIRELEVLTLPLTRAGGDAGYYQQQINTAYTGALGAIRDSKGKGAGLPDTFTERTALGEGIYEEGGTGTEGQ